MRMIDDSPLCKVVYTDTDSVIYVHPINNNPLKSGSFLGDMSIEYPEFKIDEYCSGGAKQYALRLIDKQNEENVTTKIKVRGITLDYRSDQLLKYKIFKNLCMNVGNGNSVLFDYHTFGPNRLSKITTKETTKKYKAVCEKGIINSCLDVLPFGF